MALLKPVQRFIVEKNKKNFASWKSRPFQVSDPTTMKGRKG